jgi:glycerol-3-phosphate dehydrogenase
MQQYDIAVVGAGIQGLWSAITAAHSGLKVILIDKSDIAAGTSSKTTQLIHGGLRYLESLDFRLVRESSRERAWLLKRFPHRVQYLGFVIPLLKKHFWLNKKMKLGVWLYQALSGFRNKMFHFLSLKKLSVLQPNIDFANLSGALQYFDGQTQDYRLCLELALQAREMGVDVRTYCEIDSIRSVSDGHVLKLRGDESEVECRVLINATGPWIDQFQKVFLSGQEEMVRTTKGIHLYTKNFVGKNAFLLATENQKRVFFAIPYEKDFALVGTTDTDYHASLDQIFATRSEVQGLLEELKRYFPNLPIQEADIISTYAGVRPLYFEQNKSNSLEPGKVSRHSKIIELPQRVFNLPGGKLTNARFTAEVLLKQILKKYFPNQSFSSTKKIDYGFARYRSLKKLRLECLKNAPVGLAPEILQLWISRYGSKVLHFLKSDLPLNKICEAYPFYECEAEYILSHQCVTHLADFFFRRTPLAYLAPREIAGMLATLQPLCIAKLGWSSERWSQEKEWLTRELAQTQKFRFKAA